MFNKLTTTQKMIKLGEKNILDKIEKWLNDAANEDTDVMDFLIDELGVKIAN